MWDSNKQCWSLLKQEHCQIFFFHPELETDMFVRLQWRYNIHISYFKVHNWGKYLLQEKVFPLFMSLFFLLECLNFMGAYFVLPPWMRETWCVLRIRCSKIYLISLKQNFFSFRKNFNCFSLFFTSVYVLI